MLKHKFRNESELNKEIDNFNSLEEKKVEIRDKN